MLKNIAMFSTVALVSATAILPGLSLADQYYYSSYSASSPGYTTYGIYYPYTSYTTYPLATIAVRHRLWLRNELWY